MNSLFNNEKELKIYKGIIELFDFGCKKEAVRRMRNWWDMEDKKKRKKKKQ